MPSNRPKPIQKDDTDWIGCLIMTVVGLLGAGVCLGGLALLIYVVALAWHQGAGG